MCADLLELINLHERLSRYRVPKALPLNDLADGGWKELRSLFGPDDQAWVVGVCHRNTFI